MPRQAKYITLEPECLEHLRYNLEVFADPENYCEVEPEIFEAFKLRQEFANSEVELALELARRPTPWFGEHWAGCTVLARMLDDDSLLGFLAEIRERDWWKYRRIKIMLRRLGRRLPR